MPSGGGLTVATTVARRGGIGGGCCPSGSFKADRTPSSAVLCISLPISGGPPIGAFTAGTPSDGGGGLVRTIGAMRTGVTLVDRTEAIGVEEIATGRPLTVVVPVVAIR